MAELACSMVLVYLTGEWSWVGRAMAARDGFAFRPCAKRLGHVGDHMPELGFVKAETYPNMGPECPRPAAPDPERDRRRARRAEAERRRAARALDRFVEAVGDYVLSELHHKGHYGVRTEGGKRQFCCECKQTVDTYRSFSFGSGRVHVCDACWPGSEWNTDNTQNVIRGDSADEQRDNVNAAYGDYPFDDGCLYEGTGRKPARLVCPAHGEHPHDGATCLDCPVCRPAASA